MQIIIVLVKAITILFNIKKLSGWQSGVFIDSDLHGTIIIEIFNRKYQYRLLGLDVLSVPLI